MVEGLPHRSGQSVPLYLQVGNGKGFPWWLEHKKQKPGQAFCLKGNAVYYHSALRVMIDSVFLFGVSRFTRWACFFAYEFI
jgi:hypothetical protein